MNTRVGIESFLPLFCVLGAEVSEELLQQSVDQSLL